MLSWLRPLPVRPPFSAGNPGQGTTLRAGFSTAARNWEESADVLQCLAGVLRSRGVKLKQGKERLDLENGLILRPQFVNLQPFDDGSVRTTSTIEINHLALCPAGTFEYQHCAGDTVRHSLEKGFVGWADMDLPVFVDALSGKPGQCMELRLSEVKWPRRRQILLGPPVRMARQSAVDSAETHEFCSCCLLTRSFEWTTMEGLMPTVASTVSTGRLGPRRSASTSPPGPGADSSGASSSSPCERCRASDRRAEGR
jgi:hypothetical protein